MKKKIIDIIAGWDFIISILVFVLIYIFVPEYMEMKFTLSFYNIGISVLSIVFSVFFAALAIIVSASDNEFIDFMEENGHFTHLIWTFRFTLFLLFLSLVYSIILYMCTNYYIETYTEKWYQHSIFFSIFSMLFTYSMVATVMGVNNSIKFTGFRLQYLKAKKEKIKDKNKTEDK
jgi:hypothetical protein